MVDVARHAAPAPTDNDVTALVAEAERRGIAIPGDLEYELYVQETYRRGINPWATFREYIEYLNPSLFAFEHIDTLVDTAQDVIDGKIRRLIVMLPTRYLKTEVFGRLLCSYFLRRNPGQLVGLASYNATKAWEVSDQARDYFTRSGGKLRGAAHAKKFWGPPEGGEVWAVGLETGSIGRGMHLGVCDDPIDPLQSRSMVYRRRFQEWWTGTWLGRQEPGARIVVVMQRLGVEDPIDFLFRREGGDNTELAPEEWHVLCMDEIKSNEPLGRWKGTQGLPETCTLIKDKRKVGQLLAPTRFSKEEVAKLRRGMGASTVSSQRQQRPMSPTGDFWHKDWFTSYETLPSDAYNGGRDWDTAYTADESNSASAWVQSFRGPGAVDTFPIYIEDVMWDWLEFPALVTWMNNYPGPHYVEDKATGKSVVQALRVYGVTAKGVPVFGDKFARATAFQPAVSAGRIYVQKRIYDLLLSGEAQGLLRVTAEALLGGTGGLDLNDAFVQCGHRHLEIGKKPSDKRKLRWA